MTSTTAASSPPELAAPSDTEKKERPSAADKERDKPDVPEYAYEYVPVPQVSLCRVH